MAFSEALKIDMRRRSDMRCCVCHAIGVEIHHVLPQADCGDDSADNAAPLCPTCHETYGANPTKRKFIKEARDNWFAVCERLTANQQEIDGIIELARRSVTVEDLSSFKAELLTELQSMFRSAGAEETRGQPLGEILRAIYDVTGEDELKRKQTAFLYMFVWEGSIEDEYDELKNEFVNVLGTATARRLCAFVLRAHKYDLITDGFTDDEMSLLLNRLFVLMVMLLHHNDIAAKNALEVALSEGGLHLRAWVSNRRLEPTTL